MNTTPGAPTDAQIESNLRRWAGEALKLLGPEDHEVRDRLREALSLHQAPSAALAASVASPEPVAHDCNDYRPRPWAQCELCKATLAAAIAPSPPTTPPAAEPGAMEAEDYAELFRLREAVKGPPGYATWQDAATAERVRRVKAERLMANIQIVPTAAPSTAQGLSDAVMVPLAFVQGFNTLAHNYSLKANAPDFYRGTEADAFSNAYRRCGEDLAKLRAMLATGETK